jgi:alpha-L-fucosidase 2
VAWSFYQHWRITQDTSFLRTRAYPFMKEIGTALAALLHPAPEGRRGLRGNDAQNLVLPLSSSPEWGDNNISAFLTPNSAYDATLVGGLFGWLSEMSAALRLQEESTDWLALALSVHHPTLLGDDRVMPVANRQPYDASHRHLSHAMSIWPLERVERRSPPVLATLDEIRRRGTSQWTGYTFAWYAAMLASEGRGELALEYLKNYLAFTSRTGFHVNGDQSGRGLSSFTYRPFTLEGNFIAMDAVHEMLLQSREGAVHVFPAMPSAWIDVSFARLRAEGGWVVSARRVHGQTVELEITSEHGGYLLLADPFRGRVVTDERCRARARADGRVDR